MLVSSLLTGFNSDFSFYLKLLKLEVNELILPVCTQVISNYEYLLCTHLSSLLNESRTKVYIYVEYIYVIL